MALKGPDLPGASPLAAAAVGPETVVVAVQNGVEHRLNVEPYAHGATVLRRSRTPASSASSAAASGTSPATG